MEKSSDTGLFWWGWVNAINNDETLWSKKTILIKKIIDHDGKVSNKNKLFKFSNYKCRKNFNDDCKELQEKKYIVIKPVGRNKKIMLHDEFINNGKRLKNTVLKYKISDVEKEIR